MTFFLMHCLYAIPTNQYLSVFSLIYTRNQQVNGGQMQLSYWVRQLCKMSHIIGKLIELKGQYSMLSL